MSAGPDLHIRDARDDEREAIRELTLNAYQEYAEVMAPSAWAALQQALVAVLATDGVAEQIVAERDGMLVGSVMLFPPAARSYAELSNSANWPELRLLAVGASARGQGVGQALVNECLRRAEHAGATALGLHTSDSLQAAVRLYERMGFVRDPDYDFHPEGAELVKAYRRDIRSTFSV